MQGRVVGEEVGRILQGKFNERLISSVSNSSSGAELQVPINAYFFVISLWVDTLIFLRLINEGEFVVGVYML